MRLVVVEDKGVVALNYTWLPLWLGLNGNFKKQMESALKYKIEGLPMDERGLETAHRFVMDYIIEHNPGIDGLFEYLDSLKYVHYKQDG